MGLQVQGQRPGLPAQIGVSEQPSACFPCACLGPSLNLKARPGGSGCEFASVGLRSRWGGAWGPAQGCLLPFQGLVWPLWPEGWQASRCGFLTGLLWILVLQTSPPR